VQLVYVFFPVLGFSTKKNLATFAASSYGFDGSHFFSKPRTACDWGDMPQPTTAQLAHIS
jgi:hypothetical protein